MITLNILYLQKSGRVYQIGNRLIEIHNEVINNLLQWNASQKDDVDVDYAFGLSLLLSLIFMQQIEASQIDNNAWNFMLGMRKLLIVQCT